MQRPIAENQDIRLLMKVAIRRIGVIPERLLRKARLNGDVEITLEPDAAVLHQSPQMPHAEWAEAAKRIAAHDDDRSSMGEFGNQADAALEW